MSHRNDWGDYIIITLHSDGKRRHKKWCDNYRSDNYCTLLGARCFGSAHCDFYKNKDEKRSDIIYPEIQATPNDCNAQKTTAAFVFGEHYRRANLGDKLLHKTVLIKDTPFSFKICEVVEEDFQRFTVIRSGKKHVYSKRIACKSNSVYIFIDCKNTETTEDL